MTRIERMEQSIKDVERISVKLYGTINRGAAYNNIRGLARKQTVTALRERINDSFPGVKVVVYDGVGNEAHGRWQLGNLRNTYDLDYVIESRELIVDALNDALEKIELLKSSSEKAVSNESELDPYYVLNIQKDAGEKDIKEAYRRKSIRVHPDKIMGMDQSIIDYATKKMRELNLARDKALENLSNDERSVTSN